MTGLGTRLWFLDRVGNWENAEARGQDLKALFWAPVIRTSCFASSSTKHAITLDGKLNIELLKHKEACTQGLTWDVLPQVVLQQWPQLPALIQQCGNVDVNRGEHEMQMVKRLHAMYVERVSKGETPNLEDIKKRALASKPPFAASLPHMWSFAMKFSGGKQANMMLETEQFVRNNTKKKLLGDMVWKTIVEESCSKGNTLVRWRHGLLKHAYLHGISSQDIRKSLSSKELLPRVLEANELMLEMRLLLKNAGDEFLYHSECVKAIGLFESALIQFVLGSKLPGEISYQSADAIANDAVKDFFSSIHGMTCTGFACSAAEILREG